MKRLWATGAVLGTIGLGGADALARDDQPSSVSDSLTPPASWYLPAGISIGSGLHPELGPSLLMGAELSVARLSSSWLWYGLYAEGLYDLGTKSWRPGGGLELGYRYIGLDAGYLVSLAAGERMRHGLSVRPMVTTGLITVYGRLGLLVTDGTDTYGEIGALIKYPFDLDG
jgi:hypothetical protein